MMLTVYREHVNYIVYVDTSQIVFWPLIEARTYSVINVCAQYVDIEGGRAHIYTKVINGAILPPSALQV